MWKNKKFLIIGMMKLNFFFDIDGTILPVGQHIPQSTLDAFAKAKAQGHRLFFCTGRSPFELTEELRALPFDGGVFSAGAHVVVDGKTIFSRYLTDEQRSFFFSVVDCFDLLWIIQSDDGSYLTQETQDYYCNLTRKVYSRSIDFLGFHIVDSFPADKPIVKLFILSKRGLVLEARKALEGPLHSVNNTNGLPPECAAELMGPDLTKASGINHVLAYLGEDRASTVGIGDGENDIEMIETCNLGIAMGNACKELKEKADFVTTDILDDGLAKAMEYAMSKNNKRKDSLLPSGSPAKAGSATEPCASSASV